MARRIERAAGAKSRGFTLVEALLAVAITGLVAAAVTDTFGSGLRALAFQSSRQRLDSEMRSRMELLLAQPPAQLTAGSAAISVDGRSYTLTWQVQPVDLDADGVNDSGVRQLTVSCEGRSLVTLAVDPMGQVAKL